MDSILSNELPRLVITWAEEALKYAIDARKNLTLGSVSQKSAGDLVTTIDIEIERLLTAHIQRYFPDHSICGEESLGVVGNSLYKWYIDPLDGTINYVASASDYSISVAIYREDTPLLGVVWSKKAKFAATRGKIIQKPDFSICRRPANLDEAVIHFSPRTMAKLSEYGGDFLGLMKAVRHGRYLGSSALELCAVAIGSSDIFIAGSLMPWDYAAARVVLEAEGCRLLVLEEPLPLVLAWRDETILRLILPFLPSELYLSIEDNLRGDSN